MTSVTMRRVKLKEVCQRITVGHVGPMANEYTNDGIPFLRSQNISPFRLNTEDIKFIPREFHEKIKKSALNQGDVAVVRTGYPGTACVIPPGFPELNCADLVVITPSDEINSYYLAAIFNSAWGRASVAGNLVGVAQQHFNVGAAKELEIGLPPRAVQDRIAGILSAYDDLIENSERRIKILESMSRALYCGLFVHALEVQNWPQISLGDLITLKRGYDLPERLRRPGQIQIVSSSGVTGFHDKSKVVGPGLVTGRYGTLGEVHLVWDDFWPLNTSLYVADFRDTPLLYAYWLLKNILKDQSGSAAAVPGLNRNHLHQLTFPAPPQETRRSFHAIVEPMARQARSLQCQILNLRQTRDLLLPRLLLGQVIPDLITCEEATI